MGVVDKVTNKLSAPALDAVFGKNAVDPKTGEMTSESKLNGPANELIAKILDLGFDGKASFDSATTIADKAAKAGSGEKAIDEIVSSHKKMAAAGGFVTGLGGFITMPVAIPANVAEFYILATRMVAAIAKTRGYDLSHEETRSAVLLALVGSDSTDILAKAGVFAAGGRLSAVAADRLPKTAIVMINKGVGFKLVQNLGEKGLAKFVGKGLPLVGGVIGGGLDYYMLGKIADYAKQQFPAKALGA